MDKKKLRTEIRKSISLLEESYVLASNVGILERLKNMPEFVEATQIFCYWSIGREVDTHAIIDYAVLQGKRVALPHTMHDGIMTPVLLEKKLTERFYGIPEPETLIKVQLMPGNIVIVPALAYDTDGYRMGQGGGYYDRFLSTCGLVSIGLAREQLIFEKLPRERTDMRVNYLVTEEKIRGFY